MRGSSAKSHYVLMPSCVDLQSIEASMTANIVVDFPSTVIVSDTSNLPQHDIGTVPLSRKDLLYRRLEP